MANKNTIVKAYYSEGDFYSDEELTNKIEPAENVTYVDLFTSSSYVWNSLTEVYDLYERPYYIIDTNTRVLEPPIYQDPQPVVAVVADHASNALIFEVDKQLAEGTYIAPAAQGIIVDLNGNVVVNEDKKDSDDNPTGESYEVGQDILIRVKDSQGFYTEVTPTILESNDEDKIRFAWTITTPVTDYAGTVTFSIQFKVVVFSATRHGKTYLPGDANYPSTIFDLNYVWRTVKDYQWQTLTSTFEVLKSLDMEKEEPELATIQDKFYYEVFSALAKLNPSGGGGGGDLSTLQPKILSTPVSINGTQYTTVESALQAICNLLTNTNFLVGD